MFRDDEPTVAPHARRTTCRPPHVAGVGTFSDLRLLNAEGETVEGPPRHGSVTWATWARPGTLVLDLERNHNIVVFEIDEPSNNEMAAPRRAFPQSPTALLRTGGVSKCALVSRVTGYGGTPMKRGLPFQLEKKQ